MYNLHIKEQVIEAQRISKLAAHGVIEVFDNNTWRPFISMNNRLLGDPWDRVCIHEGKIAIEHTGPTDYQIAYREQRWHDWKRMLNDYKKNGFPNNVKYCEFRIKGEPGDPVS